nr:putative F-box protein At3g52320 [Ipomoea batatas]
MFDILSKLPAKTLVRFRCVSKLFCALIADHAFGVLHRTLSLTLPSRAGVLISIASPSPHAPCPRTYYTLNFTPRRHPGTLQANRVGYLDAEPFQCSSSSDGLFICESRPNGDFVVCNVGTGQRIFLPRLIQYQDCALLLGFDSESNRYKVLMSTRIRRTMRSGPISLEYKHWVFTVGVDKSWREINNSCSSPFYPFDSYRFPYYPNTSVYIDGIIYSYNSLTNHIVAFEVGCESFSMMTLPRSLSYFLLKESALLEVGGRLTVVRVRVPELGGESLRYMNVWTWEKSKGEEITITIPLKLSRMINYARLLRFATNHDGEIVLLCRYIEKFFILVCNLKSEAWRKFDDSARNATDTNAQASHISLLITAIICFFAFLSTTTTDVWTTTTARDIKSARESNMMKTVKGDWGAILASPGESAGGSVLGLSAYCPGRLYMAAKATVAIRTATTVVEFIALLSPSECILLSRLAIFCTRLCVWRVCTSWSWTSCFMSLTVCFSSLAERFGSATFRAFTTSTCPFLAEACSAVFPLFLGMAAKLLFVSRRKLTASMWPCAAAVCKAVVFD